LTYRFFHTLKLFIGFLFNHPSIVALILGDVCVLRTTALCCVWGIAAKSNLK
jgi:hypothetical protein